MFSICNRETGPWGPPKKNKIPQFFAKKQERDSNTKPQTLHGAIFGEQLETVFEMIGRNVCFKMVSVL